MNTRKQKLIGLATAVTLLTTGCELGRLVYYPPGTYPERPAPSSFRNLFACGPGPACIEGQLPYAQSPEWVQQLFAEGSWVQVSENTIVGADDQAIITTTDGQEYVAGLDQSTWLRLPAGKYHIRVANEGLQQWVRFIGEVQPASGE